MVLRKQLEKDPQFQVALELVQNKDMYSRIITPADAKVTPQTMYHVLRVCFLEGKLLLGFVGACCNFLGVRVLL